MDSAEKRNDKEALLRIIGANIRRYRKEKGWSQEHLANMADVDRSYIGYVENAKHNVTIGFLCDIANALEINLSLLFHS
jgi:transcriptional regulator with XRE-family HTH domain